MNTKLGAFEDSEYPTDIVTDFQKLQELMKVFRNNARNINLIDEQTSPVEILSRFNTIRYTLSVLQDELVKQSIDALNPKHSIIKKAN